MIAQTIRQQIMAIDPLALIAWGARDFVNTGDGFKFRTSGMVRWKGWVHVKYNEAKDLYDIEFFRIRGVKMTVDKHVKDVYVDMLVNVINSQVG